MTEHTPGPWAWFGNPYTGSIYLATTHSGRKYVMGFERFGFRFAQPNFNKNGVMTPAKDLFKFEVGDPEVTGYDAAKADGSVYRFDISSIDHPDAKLIARAPELLAENEALKAHIDLLVDKLEATKNEIPPLWARIAELEAKNQRLINAIDPTGQLRGIGKYAVPKKEGK